MNYPITIGIFFILLGSSLVTWMLWRDRGAETKQKICQILLVWLIPGLGAFIVYWFVARWEKMPSRAGKGYAIQGEEGDVHFSGAG